MQILKKKKKVVKTRWIPLNSTITFSKLFTFFSSLFIYFLHGLKYNSL